MKRGVIKNKRAVSVLIGYIMLVAIIIVISAFVYQWMSSYIPTETLECSEGVSILVEDYVYLCDDKTLNITVKNNGRFNVAGYYIHASYTEGELATTDISSYESFNDSFPGAVRIPGTEDNSLRPDQKKVGSFELTALGNDPIYALEIIPIRYEEVNDRKRLLSCTSAKLSQPISCHSGIAELSASHTTPQKNVGERPPGANPNDNWWYFDTTLSEIGGVVGITIESRQKCYEFPTNPSLNSCGSVSADFSGFGTSTILAGGSIYWNDNYVYTNQPSMIIIETFNGTDNNGNLVSDSYTFSVS